MRHLKNFLFAFVFFLVTANALHSADTAADWTKYNEAVANKLPQTAITSLEVIIEKTLADYSYDEALKAILLKAKHAREIDGGNPAAQIRELRAYLDKASGQMKPMLTAALAHAWQSYYTQNRWRLLQRTATAEGDGGSEDFLTWDATRVLREIDELYSAALLNAYILRRTPVSTFDAVLEKGNLADAYRPTLYDFLVHDAIAFYSLGEQGVTAPENEFSPAADSPILGTLEEFLAWEPQTTDTRSPKLKAIRLFQDLLRFHQDDTDALALSDADMQRILWAGKILGDAANAATRQQSALRHFIERWQNLETASNASATLARVMMENSKNNPADAYAVAKRGIALHPKSIGAENCRHRITLLEAQELRSITTEAVWNAPSPEIAITHKNLPAVTFRAVSANWLDFLDRSRNRPNSLNAKEFSALLKKAPTKTWTVTLPKNDYTVTTHKVAAPDDLAPGFYFIIASANEQFTEKKNALAYTTVWVSDLALLAGRDEAAKKNPDDNIQGFVLNAVTGDPIPDATVTGWYRGNGGARVNIGETQTDELGAFSINGKKNSDVLLFAKTADGQMLSNEASRQYSSFHSENETLERTRQYIHFLTDRAIYRPGQTIQFKAVVYSANRDTDQYQVIPGKRVVVAISDPNNKEAARVECVTNGFGSISGSFVVPAGRLNGNYALHTVGPENGRGYISIEEYKRPKFEVTLNAPITAPKLDETVTLEGVASAYTGAPIGNATVKWSVRRGVSWPRWCWWIPYVQTKNIAHGTVTADAAGKFKIEFLAEPDKSVDPQNEPVFTYTVNVEVTDSTGETRDSSRQIRVGYTALQADISADEWQITDTPVTLNITSATLDDVPQTATGTVMIYSLKQPEKVLRKKLGDAYYGYNSSEENPADPRTWKEDAVITTERFTTDEKGKGTVTAQLAPGIYRAVLTTQDRFGKPVTARTEIRVTAPAAAQYAIREPFAVTFEKTNLQPGDTFNALWSSGYDTARALVSIEKKGKILHRFWTEKNRSQQHITFPVTEAMRGGFVVTIFQVRENRHYSETRTVTVPWENKKLDLKWERFTSKLVPGEKEKWSLRITAKDGADVAAEVTAALYDASLNQFRPNEWSDLQGIFSRENSYAWRMPILFTNVEQSLNIRSNKLGDDKSKYATSLIYRDWKSDLLQSKIVAAGSPVLRANFKASASLDAVAMSAPAAKGDDSGFMPNETLGEKFDAPPPPLPSLDTVTARTNLKETAFFFPSLITENDGTVRIDFTAPEALTRWRFLAFAHDKELRSGTMRDDSAVTAKDFMVQPNAPRFVREGDVMEFAVKLTNQSDKPQTGKARLTFTDARHLYAVDPQLENKTPERDFHLAANSSQTIFWRIKIPDGQGFLIYKAVATTGTNSDGEEGFLPVLSRRQLVTESLPLPIRGAGEKTFRFDHLLASGSDATLRNESVTVQMTSNPAWYAVLALPYLMEYPHECSEQVFSRLYANALSTHIANSDFKIATIFEQWRNTSALDSPLLKNENLKSVLISETPWVRDAEGESAARRNIGILFDRNRTSSEIKTALKKLRDRQQSDGRWSWFPDGPANDYITCHIVAGFGKLRHLGVDADISPATRAIPSLDGWLTKQLAEIKESAANREVNYKEENNLTPLIAFHLYARAFFLKAKPITDADKEAYDYFREQGRKHWGDLERQSQAHLALALHRFDNADATPAAIITSLREHAKTDDELGMYWVESRGWFWWQAPVETHVLMIEVFDEIVGDADAVDALQTWLLKQKQTQAWRTTKATADAVYALLLRGVDKLTSDKVVTVTLGEQAIQPKNIRAGTGFYSERIDGTAVKPEMGNITVKKSDDGVAWGSVTWQYFQDIDKITRYVGTPLTLTKTLWKKVNTRGGDHIVPVSQYSVQVGDTLVVRIELRVDRDMEFVHLKDQRGSGTEPVNVLSGYRWKDGLGYYESTGDTATNFFFDRLPKGTYVFEYPVRVQLRGAYQSGIAEIQCMYAPEFNSHSESILLTVE